jgi:predicted RNA-binding Zn-ribbon protein involved in translation (DUF1610 family)
MQKLGLEEVKSLVSKVLEKSFTGNHSKQKIYISTNRLNFSCPYCGDSHKNNHAKRGNLYYNRLIFICFNCDKKTTFDRMCKHFNEQIDPDKKLEMIQHLDSIMTYNDYYECL